MTDLPAALLALLREVREEMPRHHGEVYDTWQARVDARIARRWASALKAAVWEMTNYETGIDSRDEAIEAALHAARAARSTPEERTS